MSMTHLVRTSWSYLVFIVHPAALPLSLLGSTLGLISSFGPFLARVTNTGKYSKAKRESVHRVYGKHCS